jgi:dTMP kinase
MTGRFITLEGGEGSGKSTQARRLGAALEAVGRHTVVTREPGGSPAAERLREVLLSGRAKQFGTFAEAVIFASARDDHLRTTIRPALARGDWVVSDRFADSTRVYQGALGNIDPRLIMALERLVVGPTKPDLTLVLDLPATTGLQRAASRGGSPEPDRFEAEDLAFHERLRESFLEIAEREPERCVLIDATPPPDRVAAAIWEAVAERFGLGSSEHWGAV